MLADRVEMLRPNLAHFGPRILRSIVSLGFP